MLLMDFDGYLLPYSDEHDNHFPAERDKRLQFLTGFTGSAGFAVVLSNSSVSAFFTDGRYTEQADQELDCHWQLFVDRDPMKVFRTWIVSVLEENSRVGADARLISKKSVNQSPANFYTSLLHIFTHVLFTPFTYSVIPVVDD